MKVVKKYEKSPIVNSQRLYDFKIALIASAGDVGEIRDILTVASEMLGDLYIDITMITGDTVDIYRDYELFKQIGNMQERLEKIKYLLNSAAEKLLESSGEKSGSNYSIIMNMIQVITQMLDNKYEAHRYKDYYYTNYCSVSSVVQNLNEMPLSLDKIVLSSPVENSFHKNASIWENIPFTIKRLLVTFTKDYTAISDKKMMELLFG